MSMAGPKLYHISKAIKSDRETIASSCLVHLHRANNVPEANSRFAS